MESKIEIQQSHWTNYGSGSFVDMKSTSAVTVRNGKCSQKRYVPLSDRLLRPGSDPGGGRTPVREENHEEEKLKVHGRLVGKSHRASSRPGLKPHVALSILPFNKGVYGRAQVRENTVDGKEKDRALGLLQGGTDSGYKPRIGTRGSGVGYVRP